MGAAAPVRRGAAAVTPEALSERESEVMRLLAQAMSNKRIARALAVSPETVKWHLRNVYGKLGAPAAMARSSAFAISARRLGGAQR